MSNVICSKCGAEASSKCPVCRTVFPENQIEALLSHSMKFKVIRDYERGGPWLQVEIFVGNDDTKDDYALAVEGHKRLLARLQAMETKYEVPPEKPVERDGVKYISMGAGRGGPYPSIEQWCCTHRWVFKPGCKSTIGCGHGPKK